MRAHGVLAMTIAVTIGAPIAGCRGESKRVLTLPAIPSDVAYVAAIARRSDGALIAATPLVPAGTPRLDLTVEPDLEPAVDVLGYRASAFAGVVLPPAEALVATPLEIGEPCERKLPAPSWAAPLDAGAGGASSPIPALTAEWMSSQCGASAGDVVFAEVRCLGERCPIEVSTTGCRVDVDLGACAFKRLALKNAGPGEVCVLDEPSTLSCTSTAPPRGAWASFDCRHPEPCRVDVYTEGEPWAETREVRVHDVPNRAIVLARDQDSPQAWFRWTGYLADLLVLGDRVAVFGHGGGYVDREHCLLEGRSTVTFIDADSLAPIGTATAPPCLTRVAPDPDGSGWIGVFGAASATVSVGRFDATGRLLRSRVIAPAAPDTFVSVGELTPRPASRDVLLLVRRKTGEADPTGEVVALDVDTFEVRAVIEPVVAANSLGVADDGSLAVISDTPDRVFLYESHGSQRIVPIRVRTHMYLGHLTFHSMSQRFLLSVAWEETWMYSIDTAGLAVDRGLFFEQQGGPLISHTWPADPTLAIAGIAHGYYDHVWRASVARFDPGDAHFLPGVVPIGYGVPGAMRADAKGRVFVTLPWEAKLVRVDPVAPAE